MFLSESSTGVMLPVSGLLYGYLFGIEARGDEGTSCFKGLCPTSSWSKLLEDHHGKD
jgi:hypothetical protein